MALVRIIPALLLREYSLVKTVQYSRFEYIGDPVNTVRIFNELEVDELCFLDIRATTEGREPNYQILQEIADECFMPLSYGGGLNSFEQVKKILAIGFEKVVLNTAALQSPDLIRKLSEHFGSQAIIAAVDVRKNLFGKHQVYARSGTVNTKTDPVECARNLEGQGAGEILLTSIDREGTWQGMDLDLISKVSAAVRVPVIAHGGAGSVGHIAEAVKKGRARAVALGSMVVFQGKGMGVLVNFPDAGEIQRHVLS